MVVATVLVTLACAAFDVIASDFFAPFLVEAGNWVMTNLVFSGG